jgi:coenzyme F420-0:L-glutamate ligase/coenzyme F420-1:gamma-L-glutamate ligase
LREKIEIIPIPLERDIKAGDRLDQIILESISKFGKLLNGDILVVAQKIVSKAEGRIVSLNNIKPSSKATKLAEQTNKDPRLIEVILNESNHILRSEQGVVIVETKNGIVCANAGIDQSNVENGDCYASLLPEDSDSSARSLRHSLKCLAGVDIAVIITDTFGRPFREGQVNMAIGLAGISPVKSYVGKFDIYGKRLRVTEIAVVDEIASAAELQMGKIERVPAVIVRGYDYEGKEDSSISTLLRTRERDLFR